MAQITLNSSGVASSGSLLLQTNGTTTQATVDTSGNLGLGVTPSAWIASNYVAMQVGRSGSFSARASVNQVNLSDNTANISGTGWTYLTTAAASTYQQGSGAHLWFTAPSGTAGNAITFTQAMTLDASGNLGIGTTSPAQRLHVLAAASTNTVAKFESGTSSTIAYLQLTANGQSNTNSGYIGYSSSNEMSFFTTNTERARIDSSGNLLVGTTSLGNYTSMLTMSSDSGTNKWSVGPLVTLGSRFYISASLSGGLYLASTSATSWTSISDERFKENLEPIENAAQKLTQLRAVTGTLVGDSSGVRKPFLIAQDVLNVLPEAVDTATPERLGLSYTDTIPLLVAAIKEQQAIITQLQADVAALKGQA